MKKWLLGFLGFCFLLTGLSFAEKFKLGVRYEHLIRDMELEKEVKIVKDRRDNYWNSFDLLNATSQENFSRLYLESSLEIIPSLAISGIVGVGTTDLEITNSIRNSAGYDNIYTWTGQPQKMEPVLGKSQMSFLYGFGGIVNIYKNSGFEVRLKAQYIYQESPTAITLFEQTTRSSGFYSFQDIEYKSEIQEIKSQETQLILEVSTALTDKLTFVGGPMILWVNNTYAGNGTAKTRYVNYENPVYNNNWFSETEFELQMKNTKKLFPWARLEYSPNNQVTLFAELRNGFAAGLKFAP